MVSVYRVIQQVPDLGWVECDFGCSSAYLILVGLMRARQNWQRGRLCYDIWKIQIKVNLIHVRDLLNHPVCIQVMSCP